MTGTDSSLRARLYDANAEDQEVDVRAGMAMPSGSQLLWVDVSRNLGPLRKVDEALGWTDELTQASNARPQPRLAQAEQFVRISVIGLERDAPEPKPVP